MEFEGQSAVDLKHLCLDQTSPLTKLRSRWRPGTEGRRQFPPTSSLLEKFLLVKKFSSTDTKLGPKNPPFLGKLGGKFEIRAPTIPVGNVQLSVGKLQLPAHTFLTHDAAVHHT